MKSLIAFLLFISVQASAQIKISDEALEKAIQSAEGLERQTADPASFEKSSEIIRLQQDALKLIDQAIQERMVLFVSETADQVLKAKKLSPETTADFLKSRDEALNSMNRFGTAQDFVRFNAFYDYVARLKAQTAERPALLSSVKSLWQTLVRAIRLLTPFIQLSYRTLFPVMSDNRGTPLTKAADHYFGAMAESRGVEVAVTGPKPETKGLAPHEINVILSNHVAADHDAMALSQVGLESYITFGALNLKGEGIFSLALQGPFKAVMKQIDRQRDLIMLGRQGDPLARMTEVLKSQRTKNLFLFPQGMISLGFNELNPLKPNFSEKVLLGLISQGFKINLYVMTMPDNFEGAPGAEKIHAPTLRVLLEKPYTPEQLEQFIREHGGAAMDTLIRAKWLTQLRKAHSGYVGVLRENSGPVSCQKVF